MLFEDCQEILVIDQNFTKNEVLDAIATSNILLYLAGRLKRPLLQFWTLNDTVILGHMDTKLKSLDRGLAVLRANDFNYVVRNAGGLGVVSDAGILNASFYFPEQVDVSINDAYDATTKLTQAALSEYPVQVETGEITDSYCPGTYDLSIAGLKFSGQAQRRTKDNIGIMLYYSVFGDQEDRGAMMHDFYEQANVPVHPKLHFPAVNPASMINLADKVALKSIAGNNESNENLHLKELILAQLVKQGNTYRKVQLADIIDEQFALDFEQNMADLTKRMEALPHD